MGDSIYVIKPDTFFSNIAQDNSHSADSAPHYENIWSANKKHNEYKLKIPYREGELMGLYNAIKNWNTVKTFVPNCLIDFFSRQFVLSSDESFTNTLLYFCVKRVKINTEYSKKRRI